MIISSVFNCQMKQQNFEFTESLIVKKIKTVNSLFYFLFFSGNLYVS